MSGAARIVVHSLAHAKAALEAGAELGRPVTLASASGAACAMGPRWFLALVAEARAAFPGAEADCVLDCADEPGTVLASLRAGAKRVRFAGRADVRRKLIELAQGFGAAIEHEDVPSLDLLDSSEPLASARAWLVRPALA